MTGIILAIVGVAAIVAVVAMKQAFGAAAVKSRPGKRGGWR